MAVWLSEYLLRDGLPEGMVLCPLMYITGAAQLPQLLLRASAFVSIDIDDDTTQWPMVAFLDDTTLIAFRMRGLQLAVDVLDAQADAAGGVSDSHKVCVQLCLDVQAFGTELAAVGVQARTLPEYAALQEAVVPAVGSAGGAVGV